MWDEEKEEDESLEAKPEEVEDLDAEEEEAEDVKGGARPKIITKSCTCSEDCFSN